MDLSEAIQKAITTRRSIRKFTSQNIEEEKLHQILESIRLSPSWANMQCWQVLQVKSPELRKQLSDLAYVEAYFAPKGYKTNPAQKAIAEAPCTLVLCADPSRSGRIWDQNYYLVDCGIAAQSLMLTAHCQGLGSVFVGVFDEAKIKELLQIPREIRVVGLFPIGYPLDPKKDGPARKNQNDFVHSERW